MDSVGTPPTSDANNRSTSESRKSLTNELNFASLPYSPAHSPATGFNYLRNSPPRPALRRQPQHQPEFSSSFRPFSLDHDEFDPVIGSPTKQTPYSANPTPDVSLIPPNQYDPESFSPAASRTRTHHYSIQEVKIATRYVIVGNVPCTFARVDLERIFAVSLEFQIHCAAIIRRFLCLQLTRYENRLLILRKEYSMVI